MSGLLWPVKGTITQGFGRPAMRVEPTMYLQTDGASNDRRCRPAAFTGGVQYTDVHPGTDVACPVGTPVLAPANGHVLRLSTYRVWNPFANGGKGALVYVHDIYFGFGGAIYYATHLGRPDDATGRTAFVLPEGASVIRGQRIAKTGDSGIVTGPHIHEELRQATDPQRSWAAFRWNLERLRIGGDLAGLPFIRA